jgi:hypothetical protein
MASKRISREWGCAVLVILLIVAAVVSVVTLIQKEGDKGQECIGLSGWQQRDTAVTYHLSTRNVLLGVLFVETFVVPAYIALETAMCPVPTPPQEGR